jgi:cyclopropane-fatty-acyl-phospholipid synthase
LLGEIHVTDQAAWGLIAGSGSIGAGEAFIHGYWSSPDLTAVVRVFVGNLEVLDSMEGGIARLSRPLVQSLHWLNRNTRKGSQKNIAAHYDLGNDLFEQFLDPTMMYSAAQFLTPEDSLEQAQLNKLERICQKLALKPGDHLLEIGTGWGSMAFYAAQNYGCHVTTTTLSHEQYAFTAKRIEQLGLQDRVTLLLQGLPRPYRRIRQTGVDRDDRSCRSPFSADLFQTVRTLAQEQRLDAVAGDHHP